MTNAPQENGPQSNELFDIKQVDMLSHTAAHNAYDARMAHIESSEESQQMIRRYPLRNIDDIVRETGVENKMRLARYAFAMDNSGSLPSDDERRAASLASR